MKEQRKFPIENVSEIVDFVIESLTARKIKRKDALKAGLQCEEAAVALRAHAPKNSEISVCIEQLLSTTRIQLKCSGEPCEIIDSHITESLGDYTMDEAEEESVIRSLLLKRLGNAVTCKHVKGQNIVRVSVIEHTSRQLILTLGGMLFGAVIGLLLQFFAPQSVTDFLCDDLFSSVVTMFMNAIKMIVTPLVFFSIASSVAGFGDIRSLGKTGLKVVFSYFATSLFAILLGFGIFHLFQPGDPALLNAVNDSAESYMQSANATSTSIKDFIVGIVPSNFFNAFAASDMLQVIFLAVLIGIGSAKIGKASAEIRHFLDVCNDLFSRITSMIIRVLPLSAFCAMAQMTSKTGLKTMAKLLPWLGSVYTGCLLVLVVYALILVFVRRRPSIFFKKFGPAMLTAYSMSSSNAVLPISMDICGEKLGISRKLYSFSLPLGATINMDGGCVLQVVSALFLAKVYNVPLQGGVLFSLFLTVMALSVGAPAVPGANLVCVALIIPQIGIPMEAISLLIGLYPLASSIITMVNCTGDAVITTAIATTEKQIDENVFNAS